MTDMALIIVLWAFAAILLEVVVILFIFILEVVCERSQEIPRETKT